MDKKTHRTRTVNNYNITEKQKITIYAIFCLIMIFFIAIYATINKQYTTATLLATTILGGIILIQ